VRTRNAIIIRLERGKEQRMDEQEEKSGAPQGEEPSQEEKPKGRQAGDWWRLPYLVLFVVIYEVTQLVVFLIMVVQFVLKVVRGRVNERLRRLGGDLGRYTGEVISYLTYRRDEPPYPFGDWPREP
jgi:hypothetical protein